MKKITCIFFFCIFFCSEKILGDSVFGYIAYSSDNIGDDIQSIAVKRFLPHDSIAIDREFLGQFSHPSKVNTIINGWYMNSKCSGCYRRKEPAPEKNWPPSCAIHPLLISIHFTKNFIPTVLSSHENRAYLNQEGPIGARDYHTLQELQKRDIPCYFSGCLTLTLENSYNHRDDIIYAVDLDHECINFIKSKTKYTVEVLTHTLNVQMSIDPEQRLKYAEEILEKYRRAKCVITSRLHASMPCLAFETPVLLINTQTDQYRFDGLRELVRNCSKKELLAGTVNFNFDEPTENPKHYIPIRENLIKIVTDWVAHHSKTEQQDQPISEVLCS